MRKLRGIILLILEIGSVALVLYFLKKGLANSHHHEINTIMPMFVDIAFLALFASFGGKVANIFKVAPMAGKILMGVVAGPAVLGILLPDATGVELARLAGVLFILFEAGLHFDMELLKKNISIAMLVAVVGVLVPLLSFAGLGYFIWHLPWIQAVFLGGIFTATSVGLAVEALKRSGMLDKPVGNKIIGAAVIDDILGVIILTALSKLSEGHFEAMSMVWLGVSVLAFIIGTYVLWNMGIADKIAKHLDQYYVRQTTGAYTRFFFSAVIMGGALAAVIGLEPVLGAFGMGVVLSKVDNKIKHDAWEKIEGYMHIFVGGFLVSIGTMLPREALVSLKVWGLAILFTVIGFYGKYLVRYLFKSKDEGKLVGYAMAIRGEVGLVFIAVALANHALDETFAAAALLAVIIVTVWGAIVFQKEVEKASGKKMEAPKEAI
jgi:Kef-type K+ transport system membrane component KefB